MIQIIMILLITLAAVCGIGMILADVFRVPTYAVSKATHNLGKKQSKKTNPLEIWLKDLSGWLADRLRLNEYKRLQLDADLKTADMDMTPEQYVANGIVKALFVGVFAIPFLFFSKIISVLIIICAVCLYINESKKVSNKIKDRRRKIEYELPRLVANIEKTLVHSRDVLSILDTYKDSAGPELKRELDITVADMRSGNYEVALTRLEPRVGSSMMSDITRGLIGVIRGDETSVYWGSLSMKFAEFQRENLKNEANKAPKRIRKLSMVMLICFMLIYIVVIGQTLLSSLGGMLG